MAKIKEIILVAFTFVSIVVSAGFATGQEIFQFFTSNGYYSIIGILVSGFIITTGAIYVLNTAYSLRTYNHQKAIEFYISNKISYIFDLILTVFLFALAIVMTAGGASTLHESFEIPYFESALIFTIAILLTLFLQFKRLMIVLSVITPFLIIIVITIAVYYFTTSKLDFESANLYADHQGNTDKWWLFDAINYGSLQIAAAFSFLTVMGGKLKYRETTFWGGLIGGIIITLLLIILNLGMITEFEKVTTASLPSLLLANNISPILGMCMSIIMVLVIYNTVVGLMYAFASRFTIPHSKNYNILVVFMVFITFITSFIGFTPLISSVFPIMGIFGLFLLIPIFYKSI